MAAGRQILIGGPLNLNISSLTLSGSGKTLISGVIGDILTDPSG